MKDFEILYKILYNVLTYFKENLLIARYISRYYSCVILSTDRQDYGLWPMALGQSSMLGSHSPTLAQIETRETTKKWEHVCVGVKEAAGFTRI